MGLLGIFSGKSPEELERRGDQLAQNREYGLAVLEYEKAIRKLEKKPSSDPGYMEKLGEKKVSARESLAREHLKNAEDLMTSGILDEAEELVKLASSLTEDPGLVSEIKGKLAEIKKKLRDASPIEMVEAVPREDEGEPFIYSEDENFGAIISSLSPEESKAYQGYGENFKSGYVALHNGDFETAVEKLSAAMDENPDKKSFIPLELATAKINLGMLDEALSLLERFISFHPGSTRAYTSICEILWEREAFDDAHKLISSAVPGICDSVSMKILQGETFFHQKKYDESIAVYNGVLDVQGWDENIARFLAKAYELSGAIEAAKKVYGEILGKCQGCGKRPDPYIMQRFAETSFKLEDYSKGVLEIYLNLSKTDPENRTHYFKQISTIYSHMGNEKEAERFSAFAEM